MFVSKYDLRISQTKIIILDDRKHLHISILLLKDITIITKMLRIKNHIAK
jgi:hypothetical protein